MEMLKAERVVIEVLIPPREGTPGLAEEFLHNNVVGAEAEEIASALGVDGISWTSRTETADPGYSSVWPS